MKTKEGDVEYITSFYEHIGPKQIKMVYIENEGGWVSEEWLLEQEVKEVAVIDDQLSLFE